MRRLMISVIFLLHLSTVYSHQTSTSFVSLEHRENSTQGIWKVAIGDLHALLSLDIDNDGEIRWLEVKQKENELILLLRENMDLISKGSSCAVTRSLVSVIAVESILDRNFIIIPFSTNCILSEINELKYRYYFEYNNEHKAIITLLNDKAESSVHVLSVNNNVLKTHPEIRYSFGHIVTEGIWHIWLGFDHILFLLTLIVGVLFINSAKATESNKTKTWVEVVKVVSAFTIAHSITLGLASLGFINLPNRFIEPAIAITLVIAALYNIRHLLPGWLNRQLTWSVWKMAFIFGLIHGFGFANVLAELNLPGADLALTLLAFNLGVELGQLAIVVLFISILLLLLSKKRFKHKQLELMLPVSSGFVICTAGVWFVERAFDISVI
ncbi:HupE/UreJ family protein [Beggiatoa alba]|nr:HupE/UreJ family protein [Beggiatoa alba]